MNMIVLILMTALSVGGFVKSADLNVAQAFKDNKIVPDIILEAPQDIIYVNYSTVEINLGTRVSPLQTLLKPNVTFDAQDDDLHTLVFFGPDLPLDIIPPYTQFLHWMIVNIPGTSLEKGDTVSTYFPPTPYPLGLYYIFLLFKQTENIDAEELKNSSLIINRPQFDVIGFQEKYNLTGPLAGNFMQEVYLQV